MAIKVQEGDARKAATYSSARTKKVPQKSGTNYLIIECYCFLSSSEFIHAAIFRASAAGTCGIGAMGVA